MRRWMLATAVFLATILTVYSGMAQLAAVPQASTTVYLPLMLNGQATYTTTMVSATETRFYCEGHHFLSMLTMSGTLNFRPHPGVDVNGWGSSWYAQPFLAGATLGHSAVSSIITTPNGIAVHADGKISRSIAETYGTWSLHISFACQLAQKRVTGYGRFYIEPAGLLDENTGDLNVTRIASNYLHSVPLLPNPPGDIGDTGDMSRAEVAIEEHGTVVTSFTWIPPQRHNHFPADGGDRLDVNAVGACNHVDTAAQGFAPIEPAAKPGLRLRLTAESETLLTFGGLYATDVMTDFAADNVGITPLIRQPQLTQTHDIEVWFSADAPPSDGTIPCYTYEE